jgi:hypothetical protein
VVKGDGEGLDGGSEDLGLRMESGGADGCVDSYKVVVGAVNVCILATSRCFFGFDKGHVVV